MKTKTVFLSIFVLVLGSVIGSLHGQSANDTVIFSTSGSFNFNFLYSGYTPLIDRLGRPYVYLATKELGLVTFNISDVMAPVPADTQSVASLGNLKVTGVSQDSNYLLVSLGDFMGIGNAGLAIFDITDPSIPVLLDLWDTAAFNRGTSTVLFQGDYAYLGAMEQGVVILDISDKEDIRFVSRIIPDTVFGNHSYPYNSRGLFICGDTLLVADDNGGLRIIDVSDKQNPVELGKYLSSSISSAAYAFYNHVFRIGNYAYCAVDFCGFEVVDVSNPFLMTEIAWLDPWNCNKEPPPFGSWMGSDGHTNEIAYSPSQNVLMFSGADSEVLAIDPSNPALPRIMGAWGPPNDSVGTWGVDVYGDLVALANAHTFGIPFVSMTGGLQLLTWSLILGVENNSIKAGHLKIFPNPVSDKFTIELPVEGPENFTIEVFDMFGKVAFSSEITRQNHVIYPDLPGGIYFYKVKSSGQFISTGKIIYTR